MDVCRPYRRVAGPAPVDDLHRVSPVRVAWTPSSLARWLPRPGWSTTSAPRSPLPRIRPRRRPCEPMKSTMPNLGVRPPGRRVAVGAAWSFPDRRTWEDTIRLLWTSRREALRRHRPGALPHLPSSGPPTPAALELYGHMIVTGAWWDHVDEVAIKLIGPLLRAREHVGAAMRRWSRDPNRWHRRASVICQIGSRDATDALLAECILANVDDADFFLRKGVGWALREHAKTDPDWVRSFTTSYRGRLSPLSLREATRTWRPPEPSATPRSADFAPGRSWPVGCTKERYEKWITGRCSLLLLGCVGGSVANGAPQGSWGARADVLIERAMAADAAAGKQARTPWTLACLRRPSARDRFRIGQRRPLPGSSVGCAARQWRLRSRIPSTPGVTVESLPSGQRTRSRCIRPGWPCCCCPRGGVPGVKLRSTGWSPSSRRCRS